MAQKMTFNYFYGNEADQYSFYRVPKLLFTNDYFRDLSSDAKLLYGLMLDRMSLSVKNHWFDDKNRAYIYFSIEDIMELLNCGKNKAVKSLRELDDESGIGLIEKRRQGFGKANIIYVKSFLINEESDQKRESVIDSDSITTVMPQEGNIILEDSNQYDYQRVNEIPAGSEHVAEKQRFTDHTSDKVINTQEVYNVNFKNPLKQTSRIPQNKLQESLKINFKKFTKQTLIILTIVILTIVIINRIESHLRTRIISIVQRITNDAIAIRVSEHKKHNLIQSLCPMEVLILCGHIRILSERI